MLPREYPPPHHYVTQLGLEDQQEPLLGAYRPGSTKYATAITWEGLSRETNRDPVLSKVTSCLMEGGDRDLFPSEFTRYKTPCTYTKEYFCTKIESWCQISWEHWYWRTYIQPIKVCRPWNSGLGQSLFDLGSHLTFAQWGLNVLTGTGIRHPKKNCCLNQLIHLQLYFRRCLLTIIFCGHCYLVVWVACLDGRIYFPLQLGQWTQVLGGWYQA